VLFVDDDERVLNALRALFRADYEVLVAGNPGEALALLRAGPVPIVVSDQRMPGATGVEFLREVRKLYPRTVRLLLTGYSDLAAMVGSINEGEVFRFVKKPWDNDEIRATLADAVAVAARLNTSPPPRKDSPREGSILVIDPQQGLARGLEKLVAGKAQVKLVASVPEAARLLQAGEFAAIVADQNAGAAELVKLFRVVKAKRPETLSILVADEADSDLVTRLINEAQVHRLLTRPINAADLRNHVSEALRHYAAYRAGSGAGDSGARPSLVPQP
jgi:serine/threonine-protein kinase